MPIDHNCICGHCGALNAHCWDDCNMDPNTGKRDADCLEDAADVYHIPVASGWEWQCGKCKTHWVEADSPLNHSCYTHEDD